MILTKKKYISYVPAATILGLVLGYACGARDVGLNVEAKYHERMSMLQLIPASWASRVVILNVVLHSLWPYLGRHVMLPHLLRLRIERRDLKVVTEVPYFALGCLSHVIAMHGIRTRLFDFQSADVASLNATAKAVENNGGIGAEQIRLSAAEALPPRHPLRPSCIFADAYGFLFHSDGISVHRTLQISQRRWANSHV